MKKLILLFGFLLLVGCSTKFTYNNLDWLIHWYVDDYVELSDRQENLFDEHFANWLNWHRSEELAKYVKHLKSLKADVENERLTAESISDHLWKRAIPVVSQRRSRHDRLPCHASQTD